MPCKIFFFLYCYQRISATDCVLEVGNSGLKKIFLNNLNLDSPFDVKL